MEITTKVADGAIELVLDGRLDGSWASHVAQTIEESMRAGHHNIRLNMERVRYLSSLGIGVLVTSYRKAQAVGGTLVVVAASEIVLEILDLVALRETLMTPLTATPSGRQAVTVPSRAEESDSATYEVFELSTQKLRGELVGNPELLNGCRFAASDCSSVPWPADSFGFGLGALGQDFTECSTRFGEFMAVAGAVSYQPSDGSNTPDFQLAEGKLVPKMQVLYGAVCTGAPSMLARFESKPERGAVGLAELAGKALEVSGAAQAAIVCVTESAGLVGASLRRPPVNGYSGGAPFDHPEIRKWLSFTTERAFPRAAAVVVGLVARSSTGPFQSILRPLKGNAAWGHFHAAAFSYRPLQKGRIELNQAVRTLFEQETLLGILHLIGDDRDAVGVAESEFVRGACWIGPIEDHQEARA